MTNLLRYLSIKKAYFSAVEITIWSLSITLIIFSYIIFKADNVLTLIASLIGATCLIFNAKGNVWGQILTVVFSLFYGYISFREQYYGEMITYLGMTAPIAVMSVVTWIMNPAEKGKNEVRVNQLKIREYVFLSGLSVVVTIAFYFILKYFNTAQLTLSTLSILTSFVASYLTMRRSEYYAIAYTMNDIVLIILWSIVARRDISSISMVMCFVIFIVNDIYGFFSWKRMRKRQKKLE